jgi:glutamyl-tRNA synthetase
MFTKEDTVMTTPVRVRFAPSPTGYLHVGGARTALFNYLFARHCKGTFILRIEDTDRTRYQEGALTEIYESLRWLGLDWDEGPEVGGNFGPYIQSERTDLYRKYTQQLLDEGKAYRCFCTPERLAEVRLEREKAKMPTGYDRHCCNLSKEEEQKLLDSNTPYVVRFKIPDNRKVVFNDVIRGAIEYSSDVLDDLVLLKSDGFPTYHLANVVDDHCMEISHVLRGDEWIASTPRHILIYEAFGWTPPLFAHMPVILSPDGGKLSKRKGAASVMDYQRGGFLPEALFNFLALLGWAPGNGDEREKMTVNELIEAFSLEHISPKGAVFDEKKLEWMNGHYMEDRTAESLVSEVAAQLRTKGCIGADHSQDDPYIATVIGMLKSRSKRVTDIAEAADYFFADPTVYEEKAERKYFKPETAALLENVALLLEKLPAFNQTTIKEVYDTIIQSQELPSSALIHPTRLAISGVSFGPGLFELMDVLGQAVVVRRMRTAAQKIIK